LANKKAKKEGLWDNERRIEALVHQVHVKKAYISVKGENLGAKYADIIPVLAADPIFKDFKDDFPKWDAFHRKFLRLKKDVLDKYALEKEGANLSGLEEKGKPYEKVIFEMHKKLER
jgi:hypothetical protein